MPAIHLATEDALSESIGRRLIEEIDAEVVVGLVFRKGGNGYLRSALPKFCEISIREPLLLITDLDAIHCAPRLISAWFGNRNVPGKLIFRVAVREIESWILADQVALRSLFGSRVGGVQEPDLVANPKEEVLRLAARAPRSVREDLIKVRGAISSQGLGYNLRLCRLVETEWSPERASLRSESLRKARVRLRGVLEQL